MADRSKDQIPSTLGELAGLLRALRRRHARQRRDSELSYREIAARTGWSHTAIAEYFTGKTLPPVDRFDALIGLLGATAAEQGSLATARDRVAERHRRTGGRHAGKATVHQLPADIAGFCGRAEHLAQLDVLLAEAPAVAIAAVSGTAGVGKTALAVHWAHRVADRFPDGQLYVNLRGFDPTGSAVRTSDAIRRFLDGLDVPPQRIPLDPDAQAALYRSRLAGRRMLIVLDNARDVDQVRPLLPGDPGNAVVVTSRDQLSGLVAAEGAHPVVLAPLPAADARQLLAHRLGADRVTAEPEAVDEIISRCARLPVALAVAAARAAAHPGFPLAALAGELRDAGAILDVLSSGDPTTDIRAVFSCSYRTLGDPPARLFRLLAVHPGPHLDIAAAASLAGRRAAQVRPLLAGLARAHLIIEPVPGRFAFHDLLRAFATELTHATERHAATRRMLDHYLLTAHAADRLLAPHRDAIIPSTAAPGVSPEPLATVAQAEDWFAREHPALLAALDLAAGSGMDVHTWQLAWVLHTFQSYRGLWPNRVAAQRVAVTAARRLGDLAAQAHAHFDLGHAHFRLRQYDDAHAHLTCALDLYGEAGNPKGQANAHYVLGALAETRGDGRDALHRASRCRHLFRAAGDPAGEVKALNALGLAHSLNRQYHRALTYCRQAATLGRRLGNLREEARALDSLGAIHARLGQHRQSITRYRQALTRVRKTGDRAGEAETLTTLGDAHHAHGDTAAATQAWTAALAIFEELDHPNAHQVRDKLRASA
ncbi:MAG TPA: tetratricopeptide repeat protein [Actinophytocola sp.]|uniref:tetratricopeptide repeat protein n=1 Tax=Actinophytocola sp. TaxID=1872138 RepID=UPI002E00441A|nr:tetratricopeptide repeat protein [Actinophytocola sp.]